jgi:hypothetical protein
MWVVAGTTGAATTKQSLSGSCRPRWSRHSQNTNKSKHAAHNNTRKKKENRPQHRRRRRRRRHHHHRRRRWLDITCVKRKDEIHLPPPAPRKRQRHRGGRQYRQGGAQHSPGRIGQKSMRL